MWSLKHTCAVPPSMPQVSALLQNKSSTLQFSWRLIAFQEFSIVCCFHFHVLPPQASQVSVQRSRPTTATILIHGGDSVLVIMCAVWGHKQCVKCYGQNSLSRSFFRLTLVFTACFRMNWRGALLYHNQILVCRVHPLC